ncbi:MAG TPA: hypothetical protein VFZ11_05455 [Gemmatimonadaceae bacterium]
MISRSHRLALAATLVLAAGCAGEHSAQTRDSADAALLALAEPAPRARPADTGTATRVPPTRVRPLSPLADSVAALLVWAPRGQTWFAVAARGKRMVADLGRADVDPRGSGALDSAWRAATAHTAPIPVGARLQLRGAWGSDEATVAGYGWANGRIVAELAVSPRLDSLARRGWLLPGVARRASPDAVGASPDTGRILPTDTCTRGAVPPALAERADLVRDSLALWLFEHQAPPYERFTDLTRVESSRAVGCYGVGRLALVVSLRAGANEWLRQRAVILDDSGRVSPLSVHDLRFRAHELLTALDADGDGVDDLATRAVAERAGAISVLRLAGGRRLERMASGFAWESR